MKSARRKLLFVFPFPSLGGGGGAQRVLATLLRHLDRERFELHLALLQARKDDTEDMPGDVTVHNVDRTRVRYAIPALVRLARRIRPDVVFSNIGHGNLALLMARPLFPRGTRLIVAESTTLSVYLRQTRRYPSLWMALYRNFYRRAGKVVCLSRAMQCELAEKFSVPEERLAVIYNPLDLARIRLAAGGERSPFATMGPNLVAAGRFVREKGIDILLRALKEVLELRPGTMLTLLGEGPLEDELRAQARQLGVEQAVRFAGVQPNPWVYFRHADLVVVPSRLDGLPYVPLEAMASGTRVVATDCPGAIREAAEGNEEMIRLVPAESPHALAEGIMAALDSGRPGGAAALEKFSLERSLELYSVLFESGRGGER